MAGRHKGVQQRISDVNSLALFVNCDNHSLNLVGVHAAKNDVTMVNFFGIIESLYTFFSRSTLRWEKLKNVLPVTLKAESDTRWSAKVEAVRPVADFLKEIIQLLEDMASIENNENTDTRNEALQLCHRILSFDFLTVLGFWNRILSPIDRIQKRLQSPKMNFHESALDIKTLRDNFKDKREMITTQSLNEGLQLCEELDVVVEHRKRRKKKLPGEQTVDSSLTAKEEIKRVMKGTIDRLIMEMSERFTRLFDIDEKFGWLLDVNELCYGSQTDDFLREKCDKLAEVYNTDINGKELRAEIADCQMLLTRSEDKITKPVELLKFIIEFGDENVFPNLQIALKILLTIAVSIASCERSFSKLKLIKTYLRSTMSQSRVSDLAILSVEREQTEKTDFNKVIDKFASVKARKIHF